MPTISHFYGIIIVMYLRNKEQTLRTFTQSHRFLMPRS